MTELENDQGVHALVALLSDPDFKMCLNSVEVLGEIVAETSIHCLQNQ
ncbi:MAG: hypothetical protein AB2606_06010 [Candidatus Thiodiazotropha taylori]